jgi:TIR domain
MQIFISYSRDDLPFAKHLADDLAEYDQQLWMDIRNIPHGANWDIEVQRGMDSSDLMIVLLSPASVASQNVMDEWSYFIEKDKPIVPLLIVDCDVPFRLSRRQRVDFRGNYESAFQQLLKAIGSPKPLDPDATAQLRIPPQPSEAPSRKVRSVRSEDQPAARGAPAKNASQGPKSPEVGVRTLPMIWAEQYHWFSGMKQGTQGDVIINAREIALVPPDQPIITIPFQSLISVKVLRSVDRYLKLTYYGTGGAFKTLVMMGAPREKRETINQEVVNLLKLLTGRSLE